MDVWELAPMDSIEGPKPFLLIVDNFSKISWLFPITAKSDVVPCFKIFKVLIEKHLDTSIINIQSENGK